MADTQDVRNIDRPTSKDVGALRGLLPFLGPYRLWVLAAATGAIAGAILAARDGVSPSLGLFGFSVLAIVLMGGLDSFVGVFIAAMAVGILEALAQWQLGGDWVEITPYVAVLVVILIRPHGLLGQKEIERI